MAPPALGVNYTPREGWFHSWTHLDVTSTREDMDRIADLGLDHVRIFPLWPILQPNRTMIDAAAVDDVLAVVDAAGDAGLRVCVDLLQGHLSSYDFLPAWVSTWHRRSIFSDPAVVAAQHDLARVLGGELAGRPHALGMTLGNEIGQFAASRHPAPHAVDDAGATAWTRGLLETIAQVMPQGRHHHCFDDDLWFIDSHPFTPADAVLLGDSTTVHSWVFTGAGQTLGAGHPDLALFGRYLVEVAAAWDRALSPRDEEAPQDSRGIWLQEIGAPTPWVDPEDAAGFADASIRSALGHPAVEAVTWWCSHDVSRELSDFPEVEYTLGLLDAQGARKPLAEAVAQIARELREDPGSLREVSGPDGTPAPLPLAVDAMAADGSDRSRLDPSGAVFAEWFASAREGELRPLDIRL